MPRAAATAGGLIALLLACNDAAPPPVPAAPVARALDDTPFDPLADREHEIVVLVFVTPDCPVSNRYAPELSRIAASTPADRVAWWLVYPDPDVRSAAIDAHRSSYALAIPALRDPEHVLVARAQAKVTPEAAVFANGTLVYHGRIDDRVPEFGRAKPQPSVRDLQDALTAVLAGQPPDHETATAVGCPIGDL
ncbi:MAG TPA: hypothetical protein VG755_25865, partial [Nannocystaceae bacterium]|nr:hypothetical protein [Nannocystaceae bacterium]